MWGVFFWAVNPSQHQSVIWPNPILRFERTGKESRAPLSAQIIGQDLPSLVQHHQAQHNQAPLAN